MNSVELANRIRKHAIEMTHKSGASHIASILSISDIIAVLYNDILKINCDNYNNQCRNRFILSKGHAGVAVYAALAELGIIDMKELDTYYQNGSKLSGHISHKGVKGVEFSTGSLGHGMSVAIGMAIVNKNENRSNRIYSLIGDGECNEGSIWEGVMFASHNKLNNLTVIIDRNKIQGIDFCEKIIDMKNMKNKWEVFGWNVIEVDGHNHEELKEALLCVDDEKPTCIVANTIKGKGVSFMENQILWHYRDPQGEFYNKAIDELERIK